MLKNHLVKCEKHFIFSHKEIFVKLRFLCSLCSLLLDANNLFIQVGKCFSSKLSLTIVSHLQLA